MLIAITRVSPFSGKTNTMNLDVTEDELKAWQAGKLAQDAFPRLNASEREFIMSGLTEEEWDILFREEDTDCE